MKKEIFGLSGQEEVLAIQEAEKAQESAEENDSTPSYGDDYMDMTGAGGPDDDQR